MVSTLRTNCVPVLGPHLSDRLALDGDVPNNYVNNIAGIMYAGSAPLTQNLLFDTGIYDTTYTVPYARDRLFARSAVVKIVEGTIDFHEGIGVNGDASLNFVSIYVGDFYTVDTYVVQYNFALGHLNMNRIVVPEITGIEVPAGKGLFIRFSSSEVGENSPGLYITAHINMVVDDNQYVV